MLNSEERLKVYEKATKLWGLVAQYDQCVEEMGELIVAINKYKRKVLYKEYKGNSEIENNLVEEIADVSICLEQMRYFFKDKNIDEVIEKKMQKFLGQIAEMENKKRED